MKRWIVPLALVTAMFSTFGCSMCCGPYDYDYPSFGGTQQRVDARYGRVGSIFSDPNAKLDGDGPDSNLQPQPDPYNVRRNDFLDDDLELIDPVEKDPADVPGQLPDPEPDDTTASRLWKRKPLRPGQAWR